jgi:hypothetical protein
MEQLNEMTQRLMFINFHVSKAQESKGAFSMEDCRHYLNAYKLLTNFLAEDTKMAGEPELEAFVFVVQGCKVQQAKGAFTMEVSVLILEALEALEKVMDSRKDPGLKLKELERKHSHKKKSSK